MSFFDFFYNKQVKSKETPTDILVGLVCLRIEATAGTTDSMLYRSYYDSHHWYWEEKKISVDFTTQSYASNADVASVERMMHDKKEIKLNSIHRDRLKDSFNKANRYTLKKLENQKRAQEELDACDALASIIGV